MSPFAQTYLQLHQQVRRLGYSDYDIAYLRRAYELNLRLVSGRFLGHGRSYVSHGIGAASVLATLHVSIKVVVAGLLHNTYLRADFGNGRPGMTPARREVFIDVIGEEAESYLAMFQSFPLDPETFPSVHDNIENYSEVERMAVLLILADHLDHNSYNGTLYFQREESLWRRGNHEVLSEIAKTLGYDGLAERIRQVHQDHVGIEISSEYKSRQCFEPATQWVPKSCRKRLAFQWMSWGVQWFTRECHSIASKFDNIRSRLKTVVAN